MGLHWSGGRMTGGGGGGGGSVGGGRGTEMEGVGDRGCHWKGPEGPGRDEGGRREEGA